MAREREGDDATGRALLLFTDPPRAIFAWRPDATMLGVAGDDVVDPLMGVATRFGLRPSGDFAIPDERTPGWTVMVDAGSSAVTVTDPAGVRWFVGQGLDLPPGWIDAAAASGDCALFVVSRGELDAEGLTVAARQGRVASGLAAATVDAT